MDGGFGAALGTAITGRRTHFRTDGGNMRQRGASIAGRLGNGFRTEFLNGVKGVATAFGQDADAIDHMISILHGFDDGVAITQVRLGKGNLTDIAERLQEAGKIGATYGDTDAITALRKYPHDMPPDKTRTAKNGDEGWKVGQGHGRLLRSCR
ncbi:hypothetical protein D3C86_1233130 [compost metagenome]